MSSAIILDQKLRAQVQTERKVTHQILLTIQEFDITKGYRELGHHSLFDYLVRRVGYSESAAHRRISAARLLKQCPEIGPKIKEGKIGLSQLALMQSAIKQEERKSNTKVSLEKRRSTLLALEGKNHFQTQKLLLENFSEFDPPKPRVFPTRNKTIQLTLEFSEADWERIQHLLSHLSHKVPDRKVESALIYWAKEVEKKKTARGQNAPPIRKWIRGQRNYIPVKTKRQVFNQANYQCEYVSPLNQQRCTSRNFLDIDHKLPLALGGSDETENLRLLCRAHNSLMAKHMHLSANPQVT